MSQWIDAEEGVRIYKEAGLTENTFYRNVREGKIRKSIQEDQQRGALYEIEDIKKRAEIRRNKNIKRLEAIKKDAIKQEYCKTDWVQYKDLPYLLALDYEMYGIEEAVDLSITYKWWEKNPYMCRVLYNTQDRKDVWGYVTIMPIKKDLIIKLLKREIHERDIKSEDVLIYEKGGKYEVYATSIVVKPEKRIYTRRLLNSIMNYWCEHKEIFDVVKVYAYADSEEGWGMIKQLFFAPRYDIGPRVFELDIQAPNPSKLVTAFQECLKSKETNGIL